MLGMLLDRSIILTILPLLVAIPVALGLLMFISHKLRHPSSKPVSRTTGEHFQKIGRSIPPDVPTDSAGPAAQTTAAYGSRDQLPGLDDVDTISGA